MMDEPIQNDFVGDIGGCPIPATWNARREQFRRMENMAFGRLGMDSHGQIDPLILELEHVYCAGAWVAVVVLAFAIVEVYMHSRGLGKKPDWPGYLVKYRIADQAEWLRKRRNALMHMQSARSPSLTIHAQFNTREELYRDAKKAVSTALRIAFCETLSDPAATSGYQDRLDGDGKQPA